MSGHPSPTRLEEFMSGELSGDQNREVVRHLFSGCDECGATTSRLWTRLVAGRAERPDPAAYEPAFERSWTRAQELYHRLEFEREEAKAYCAEILRLAPQQQRLRVRNDSRFQTLALCDRILEATEASIFDDVAAARDQADLAREITEQLDASVYGQATVADAKARAWATYANTLRNASDYEGAVTALQTAKQFLDEGTGDPARRAEYLTHLAGLLTARRSLDEALAVHKQLEAIYKRAGDLHMVGRVQVKKAVVYTKKRQPEGAIELLNKALGLLDPARDPRRKTIALHNLVVALINAGRPLEAREHLDELRRLHGEQGGQLNLLRFRWLEGRLAHALDDLETAESCYTEVRNAFVELEIGIDVALVSLDLAQVLFDRDELANTKERLTESLAILRALGVEGEAYAALAFLERTIRAEAAGKQLIERTAEFIRRAHSDPSLRFRPSEITSQGVSAGV